MEPYKIKQVIIVRKDLNMGPGKIAAQVSHGSMAFLTNKMSPSVFGGRYTTFLDKVEEEWLNGAFAKIVVYVKSLEELHEIQNKAVEAGIQSNFIIDSGHTHFKGVPTTTVLALGPDYSEKLDPITRHLPLL